MIKTLRITGVAAVAFAGVVLASVLGPVSLIHFDDKGDQRMGMVLASPGAVERFRDLHGDQSTAGQDTKPPLIKQAEAFKDIIDPKLPPPTTTAQTPISTRRETPVAKPQTTTAKFYLIGTSCSPSNPNSSFAYIRSLDNTYKWVECGGEIGHLVIKEVREGSVICWDGHRDSEIAMEVVPDRASLLEMNDDAAASAATATPQPVEVKVTEIPANRPGLSNRQTLPRGQSPVSKMSEEEREALSELADRLKQLQASSGDANGTPDAAKIAAEKLMSEFKSSQIGPQETRRLENLGDEAPGDAVRAREELKREFLRRMNPSRSAGD